MSIHKLLMKEQMGMGGAVPAEDYFRWCFDFGNDSRPSGQAQTTISNRPIPVVENALGSIIPKAEELLDIPVQQADFDTVVPFSTQTEAALQLGEARALNGSALDDQAIDTILSTARGDFVGADNPAFNAFADRLTGDIGSRINAQFAGAGRTGSPANNEALGRGIGDALAPVAFQNFQTERQNQLEAARFLPELAQIDFTNIDRLGQVGAAREGQEGARIQDQINRFNFEQLEPRQRIAEVLALVGGGQFGSVQTQNQPVFSNSGAQALGGLASLASIFGSVNSIFKNS